MNEASWVHRGFEAFAAGRFEDGGSNLYVNAHGIIETIHRTDVDNDGYVDIVLPNAQGYNERGPTWIYKPGPATARTGSGASCPPTAETCAGSSTWTATATRT